MTKKKPGAKIGRPPRDYSDDPDREVVEWAVALQAAWDLSERKAFDFALAICQGEAVTRSKIPRGARKIGGALLGYALPMERQFRSRESNIRLKYKANRLRPDRMAILRIARLLHRIRWLKIPE